MQLREHTMALLSPLWFCCSHRSKPRWLDPFFHDPLELVCQKARINLWHPECRVWWQPRISLCSSVPHFPLWLAGGLCYYGSTIGGDHYPTLWFVDVSEPL